MAVARKRNCYSNSQYRRIAARRGTKRARLAVAHNLRASVLLVRNQPTSSSSEAARTFC